MVHSIILSHPSGVTVLLHNLSRSPHRPAPGPTRSTSQSMHPLTQPLLCSPETCPHHANPRRCITATTPFTPSLPSTRCTRTRPSPQCHTCTQPPPSQLAEVSTCLLSPLTMPNCHATHSHNFSITSLPQVVSDIAIFVLKRDVKLQLTPSHKKRDMFTSKQLGRSCSLQTHSIPTHSRPTAAPASPFTPSMPPTQQTSINSRSTK